MKLFKKFLLAAGLVGLVGLTGFASEAKADDPANKLDVTIVSLDKNNGNKVTWSWKNNESNTDVIDVISQIAVQVNGVEVGSLDCKDEEGNYIYDTESESYEFSLDTDLIEKSTLKRSISGTVKLIAKGINVQDPTITASGEADSGTDKISPWYLVKVGNDGNGSVTTSPTISSTGTIVKNGNSVRITPSANTGYKFKNFTVVIDGTTQTLNNNPLDIDIVGETTVTANFESESVTPTGQASLTAIFRDANGTYKDSITATTTNKYFEMEVGWTVTFEMSNGSLYGNSEDMKEYFTSVSSAKYTAKKVTSGSKSIGVYAKGNSGYEDSKYIYITIAENGVPKVTTSDYVEYITDGYTLEFKAKADNGSQDIKFAATSDFKDYVDSIEHSKNSDSDKTVTVKVKFKEKLDKGTNNKEIKLEATVDSRTAKIDSDTDTDTTKKVTIYSRPSASFSTSDRKLTYKTPTKVNTGTTDGKESDGDEKDNTLTKISEVKGVKLRVYNGDTSLGFTQTAKSSGTSATIDSSTMESLIINLSSKFSGDSATAKFRVYPNDSDGKYNKNVYADSSVSVYRAVITWTDEAGKTGSVNVYGFEGQTIDAATVEKVDQTLKGKNLRLTDDDGKTITSFKMGTSSSANDHKAVLGTRESAADDSGLDRVPRTGQNNALVYVMVAIVACAVCGGLYVYNKKSKNL